MKEFAEIEIDYKAVGNRIKQVRKSKGFTQQRLAEEVGYSTAQIGNTERGKPSSLQLLYRVSLRLEVTVDYLLGSPPLEDKNSKVKYLTRIYECASPQIQDILLESFEGQYKILCKILGADGK